MKLFQSMGISNTHYTAIRKLLIGEGCIRIVRQGTRSEPSLIELHHPLPPPQEIALESLTRPEIPATLSELEQRVSRLEKWVDSLGGINLSEALVEINRRLAKRG